MATNYLPTPSIQPQPAPNPVEQASRVLQMKSLLQNQQAQQQEMQIRQQAMTDKAAGTKALLDWDGKDPSDLYKGILKNGGSSDAALAAQQHFLSVRDTASQIALRDAQTGDTNLKTMIEKHNQYLGAIDAAEQVPDEQLHQHLADTVSQLIPQDAQDPQAQQFRQKALALVQSDIPPAQLRQQLDLTKKGLMGAKEQLQAGQTDAETRQANAKAALDEIQKQTKEKFLTMTPDDIGKMVDQVVPPNGANATLNARTKSMAAFALSHGDQDGFNSAIRQAGEQLGTIEKETNPAVQQGKINVATAEGKARQLVEGMEKPVYAIHTDGSKELMSATDALQSGIRTMLPVGAKEVGDDTQLINRLGDVRQKMAQYEQNLQNLGKTISTKDQSNIAALIGSQSFKAGAFGTELPVDRLNAALDKENISGLSSDAKKLLVSYYNARESMQGYQRVLSGTGRANEKAMQLNLDAMPNPGTTDPEFAGESMKQFKQNLQIVGQGLPKIPGVKSPEEIEQQVTQQQPSGSKAVPAGATHIGVGSQDKKKHYLDANGKDLGLAE
jgi:hypothetical protein